MDRLSLNAYVANLQVGGPPSAPWRAQVHGEASPVVIRLVDHPVADLVGPGGMAKDELQAGTEHPLLQTQPERQSDHRGDR